MSSAQILFVRLLKDERRMQAPTHFLAGVLIQKSVDKTVSVRFRPVITASLAVISHGFLDKLARLTYHPPKALPNDWLWIAWHSIVALMTAGVLYKHWRDYKLGITFSSLPDLDWIIVRPMGYLFPQVLVFKRPILHELLSTILNLFPPFRILDRLPNWTQERKGIIVEIVLLCLLIVALRVKPVKKVKN